MAGFGGRDTDGDSDGETVPEGVTEDVPECVPEGVGDGDDGDVTNDEDVDVDDGNWEAAGPLATSSRGGT